MPTTHYRSCTLCEATCGVAIEVEGDQVVSIRGDDADPFSRGYICPKATALADLHYDPDRLRRPMLREGSNWREIPWDEAFDLTIERLRAVRDAYGIDAIATYQGNPTAHSLGLMLHGQLFLRRLGTRNASSATSIDQLPHMLAALMMFGDQLLMPVPDLDRTEHMIVLGGNPLVSNGSVMTAPNVKQRLKDMRARGGRLVVIDPRRTETAGVADRHLFIRPGTDAAFLLSFLHVLYAEGRVRLGRLADFTEGIEELGRIAARYPPEATAAATGIAPDDVREVARGFADAPRAVLYGRVGICTQELGGLAAWLCYAINVVTGHLDSPGGMMFTTPAIDIVPFARFLGYDGGHARWTSRVSKLPEFGGELPIVTLAEEIETPGPGQVRALITSAGNPVLSSPGGPRLEKLLPTLDFMVSVDPYLNETTRFAHLILPPTSPLERAHYDAALAAFSVRNVAKYSPPLFERGPDQRHDWEIYAELSARWMAPRGPLGAMATRALRSTLLGSTPETLLALGLRTGPHGLLKGSAGLSLDKLRASPHGIDLGALEPRLPGRLNTRGKRIHLVPATYVADLPRLDERLASWTAHGAGGGLVLVGRRHLRSNNSWLHNSFRMVKGKPRCTLLVNPRDAAARGITHGDKVRLASRTGAVVVPVEISDEMMPGVVSLPHGWGHGRPGTRTRVANAHAGVSANDITEPAFVDQLSGTAALTGVEVTIERVATEATQAAPVELLEQPAQPVEP
ncbi:molybdopterin oxidoreductase family protein [Hyalangium versicolor]|uniref:molybdopterin oxidoreductase family protein n=1 Tax=Hyalangium versicolor TaxID=2861190 RepID=UPI001CCE47D8|nr:molybdopterin oxidoreductase family protein [Hyalangium versicolor]